MTVVVMRNAPDRVRGFLASCMCEIAPGIYTSPRATAAVRDRVWDVVTGWLQGVPDSSIVMTWSDPSSRDGQALRTFGVPKVELVELDGLHLVRHALVGADGA